MEQFQGPIFRSFSHKILFNELSTSSSTGYLNVLLVRVHSDCMLIKYIDGVIQSTTQTNSFTPSTLANNKTELATELQRRIKE